MNVAALDPRRHDRRHERAAAGRAAGGVGGISIDTRTIAPGEAFFAIQGENRDGHDFVAAALQAGAGLAVVAAGKRAALPNDAPLLIVPDVLDGLRDLARAARARLDAKVIGITGSVGKTGTKEALRLALSSDGVTHASVASYNNHWGVPLSLARCPQNARFAVLEMGMNHAGEIEPLVAAGAPARRHHHRDRAGASRILPVGRGDRRRQGRNLSRTGAGRQRGDQLRQPAFCSPAAAREGSGRRAHRVLWRARESRCAARQILAPPGLLDRRGAHPWHAVTYKLGAPGRHLVLNSLAVLATAALVGADLAVAALALAQLKPAVGRGSRVTLDLPGGAALLIDESYNANPASMRAAIALLGQAPVGPRGRRIAVLGDMLELGPQAVELHRGLAEPILANAVDLVFCAGEKMRALWEALPSERRGGYAEGTAALEAEVLTAIRAGDAVMVKGSLGSKTGLIVKALERRYAPSVLAAPAQG